MAIHEYRYSNWDGSQQLPDFSADDLLENMADDLLRGGDPERALRNMMKRGFRLPDGRRFEGMQRLHRQMREYRQDVFSRYDPNGIVDRVREQLDAILRTEQEEIDRRHADGADHTPPKAGNDDQSPQADGQAPVDAGGAPSRQGLSGAPDAAPASGGESGAAPSAESGDGRDAAGNRPGATTGQS